MATHVTDLNTIPQGLTIRVFCSVVFDIQTLKREGRHGSIYFVDGFGAGKMRYELQFVYNDATVAEMSRHTDKSILILIRCVGNDCFLENFHGELPELLHFKAICRHHGYIVKHMRISSPNLFERDVYKMPPMYFERARMGTGDEKGRIFFSIQQGRQIPESIRFELDKKTLKVPFLHAMLDGNQYEPRGFEPAEFVNDEPSVNVRRSVAWIKCLLDREHGFVATGLAGRYLPPKYQGEITIELFLTDDTQICAADLSHMQFEGLPPHPQTWPFTEEALALINSGEEPNPKRLLVEIEKHQITAVGPDAMSTALWWWKQESFDRFNVPEEHVLTLWKMHIHRPDEYDVLFGYLMEDKAEKYMFNHRIEKRGDASYDDYMAMVAYMQVRKDKPRMLSDSAFSRSRHPTDSLPPSNRKSPPRIFDSDRSMPVDFFAPSSSFLPSLPPSPPAPPAPLPVPDIPASFLLTPHAPDLLVLPVPETPSIRLPNGEMIEQSTTGSEYIFYAEKSKSRFDVPFTGPPQENPPILREFKNIVAGLGSQAAGLRDWCSSVLPGESRVLFIVYRGKEYEPIITVIWKANDDKKPTPKVSKSFLEKAGSRPTSPLRFGDDIPKAAAFESAKTPETTALKDFDFGPVKPSKGFDFEPVKKTSDDFGFGSAKAPEKSTKILDDFGFGSAKAPEKSTKILDGFGFAKVPEKAPEDFGFGSTKVPADQFDLEPKPKSSPGVSKRASADLNVSSVPSGDLLDMSSGQVGDETKVQRFISNLTGDDEMYIFYSVDRGVSCEIDSKIMSDGDLLTLFHWLITPGHAEAFEMEKMEDLKRLRTMVPGLQAWLKEVMTPNSRIYFIRKARNSTSYVKVFPGDIEDAQKAIDAVHSIVPTSRQASSMVVERRSPGAVREAMAGRVREEAMSRGAVREEAAASEKAASEKAAKEKKTLGEQMLEAAANERLRKEAAASEQAANKKTIGERAREEAAAKERPDIATILCWNMIKSGDFARVELIDGPGDRRFMHPSAGGDMTHVTIIMKTDRMPKYMMIDANAAIYPIHDSLKNSDGIFEIEGLDFIYVAANGEFPYEYAKAAGVPVGGRVPLGLIPVGDPVDWLRERKRAGTLTIAVEFGENWSDIVSVMPIIVPGATAIKTNMQKEVADGGIGGNGIASRQKTIWAALSVHGTLVCTGPKTTIQKIYDMFKHLPQYSMAKLQQEKTGIFSKGTFMQMMNAFERQDQIAFGKIFQIEIPEMPKKIFWSVDQNGAYASPIYPGTRDVGFVKIDGNTPRYIIANSAGSEIVLSAEEAPKGVDVLKLIYIAINGHMPNNFDPIDPRIQALLLQKWAQPIYQLKGKGRAVAMHFDGKKVVSYMGVK